MALCNRYSCVGRAGQWLGGEGARSGWPGPGFRVGVGAVGGRTGGRAGCSEASPAVPVKSP